MDIVALLNQIQAIARTGLHFTTGAYDRERYEQLLALASQHYTALIDLPADALRARFAAETGYIIPNQVNPSAMSAA
jgi:hypothetical protein